MPIPAGTRKEKSCRASLALLLVMMVAALLALAVVAQQRSVRRASRWPVVGMTGARIAVAGIKLDLNRASEAELALLPGVGPTLAKKLVDYRQRHGPLGSLEDAIAVDGIGPKLVERWRGYAVTESGRLPGGDAR